jgi:hypothetical protein
MLLRDARSGAPDARPESATAPGAGNHGAAEAAWILRGDLELALVQSGMVAETLESQRPPHVILSAGLAVVNAVLAAGADARTFLQRWEILREKRFLAASALGTSRFFGMNGRIERLVDALADAVQSDDVQPTVATTCYVGVEDGFVRLPDGPGDADWRPLLKQTLRYSAASSPMLAAAILEAGHLSHDVAVLGIDRTAAAHPDVEEAARSVRTSGVHVDLVIAPSIRPVGMLQYFLPGSGGPERLHHDGRSSAARWLRDRSRSVSHNGDGYQGFAADSLDGVLADSAES